MNTGHNWKHHPVLAKRYKMLAIAATKGLNTAPCQSAIMTGKFDEYELN
jgi:hypothetical protein